MEQSWLMCLERDTRHEITFLYHPSILTPNYKSDMCAGMVVYYDVGVFPLLLRDWRPDRIVPEAIGQYAERSQRNDAQHDKLVHSDLWCLKTNRKIR